MNLLKFAVLLLFVSAFTTVTTRVQAQTPNQQLPFSYQFYQKLNQSVYDVNTRYHSSIKAYFADDVLLSEHYDSLMNVGIDANKDRSWARRKLTQEHLFNFSGDDYTVYADFLPDFLAGVETGNSTDTWLNSRGFQVGGNIGDKFSFYTSGYENQARFANYYSNFIDSNQVVPGQSGGDKLAGSTKDWAYVTALLSYTPNKHLNLALGYDKNFIGDGYRSMLLSDNAANYSFARLRATLGNVQYQTIFAYMLDPGAPRLTDDRRLGSRGKWSAIHYLDWNITNRASIGFFQAVTWADAEVEGKRGFDFNYVHPFVFLRPLETGHINSPDKMRLGINTKYELLVNTTIYGQFMLDEFTAKEFFSSKGYWGNKWALQLGLKGSDLLKVKSLNYLAEFNTARPYTYSHFNRISNYAHYNQALAHPLGANFREGLAILNYSYKRFDIQGQILYAEYGVDLGEENYGKDIFKSYDEGRLGDFNNRIAQGSVTNLKYGEIKIAYLLNPKYNLRLEASTIYRQETFDFGRQLNANWFNVGLRSSFRNLYTDF
jgi:hypothetical protein